MSDFWWDVAGTTGMVVLVLFLSLISFAIIDRYVAPKYCSPNDLDFRKPGLYRCLTLENGTRDWVRVEEDY